MPDLRQMAARWLASVGVLPHDSPALQEGPGGALEFALILQVSVCRKTSSPLDSTSSLSLK
jgi:hypothetical protein